MAKKSAIPKEVAGFKVPKTIRKSKPLNAMLASKTGREIIGKALVAGAAAAAAVLAEEREDVAKAGKKGAGKGTRAAGIAGEAIQSAAHAAMGVVTDSARSYLPHEEESSTATRQTKPKKQASKKTQARPRKGADDRPFASNTKH